MVVEDKQINLNLEGYYRNFMIYKLYHIII